MRSKVFALNTCCSLTLILLVGCSDNSEKSVVPDTTVDSSPITITSSDASDSDSQTSSMGGGDAGTDSATAETSTGTIADDIFKRDTVHRIDIQLPEEQWLHLQKTARDEQYTQAEVVIDGQTIGTSGLRFKGNRGTLYTCFNALNQLICPKLSLKIKFNEYNDEQRFQNMKRINLHAMAREETLLAEYLGYDLFRLMKVIAPRTSWTEVFVNGKNLGVYSVVEQVDGRFIKNRFEENNDGVLYKEAWPVLAPIEYFNDHVKTNEETATHQNMLAFATELQQATDDTLPMVVSRWIDVDSFLRYIAVSEAVNNWDGPLQWNHCNEIGECSNRNYYLYDESSIAFFRLIAWDLDNTFRPHAWLGSPPSWNDLTISCDELSYLPQAGEHVMPPSCDPLVRGVALSGKEKFVGVVDELIANYFNEPILLNKIDVAVSLLSEAVDRDPVWKKEAWLLKVRRLKEYIPSLKQRLIELRDGIPRTSYFLKADGVNDFESATNANVYAATRTMTNPVSQVDLSVNSSVPVNGNRSLKMSVRFDDDGKVSFMKHWAFAGLFLSEMSDLSSVSEIRLTVRTDSPRPVTVAILSPESATIDSGGSWQWTFPASDTPQTLSLSIADLSYPIWWVGPMDDLNTILSNASGLRLITYPNSVGESDLMTVPEFASVEIDDIEFVHTVSAADTDSEGEQSTESVP